jgi:hypothetical protein
MTGPVQHPTSELVAAAWIAAMTPIPAAMVATQPPQDVNQWTAFVAPGSAGSANIRQFVTVRVVGGTPGLNTPVWKPVVEVQCYATNPGSNKPPWGSANQTLELIRLATFNRTANEFGRALSISVGNVVYNGANVLQAVMHTEPRRLYSSIQNYAVYQADMGITWREIGLLIP